jgi:hypothetical protein
MTASPSGGRLDQSRRVISRNDLLAAFKVVLAYDSGKRA